MRAANYIGTLRRDLFKVAEACGVEHPGLIDSSAVEVLTGRTASTPLAEVYGYREGWGLPSAADRAEIVRLMVGEAPQGVEDAVVVEAVQRVLQVTGQAGQRSDGVEVGRCSAHRRKSIRVGWRTRDVAPRAAL